MPKTDWEENSLAKLFDIPKVESILDVACGLSLKSKFIPAQIRVGVDIYEEYFKHIESAVPYVVIKHDVRKLTDIFLPKSFDLVIACDIIEHLEKAEALEMIKQCEQIARVAVILETPNGYIPQNLDILGYGGHEWQTHKCGWDVKELEDLGYTVKLRSYEMANVQRHTTQTVDTNIQLIEAMKYV